MMTDLTPLLAEPDALVAVIGATDHSWKYGSIIYRDLKARGIRVVPVNPHRATVDGDRCYPNLSALPEQPTIIDLVVPPAEGHKVVEIAGAGPEDMSQIVDALRSREEVIRVVPPPGIP